jgi:hypothetical protein
MSTRLTNEFTFAITLNFLMLILLLLELSDVKLWRFGAGNKKISAFRIGYMRQIYDFCDRNGARCHNCRKDDVFFPYVV